MDNTPLETTPSATQPNTYTKYCPNVFVAKCPSDADYEKGDEIILSTKHGKQHECIVFNFLGYSRDGFKLYSIVRADGFNVQQWCLRRAERMERAAKNAAQKSALHYEKSNERRDFLSLGEPIKVGHHSERKHRNLIARVWENAKKSYEFSQKSEEYANRVGYWEARANTINLSMPESIELYECQLETAKAHHEGLKNGTIKREHGFSLTYAKKRVNELEEKVRIARKLWGDAADTETPQ